MDTWCVDFADVEPNSFALHTMLTALSPADVWSQEEVDGLAQKVNHHMSCPYEII
jgi:hypothetical protein